MLVLSLFPGADLFGKAFEQQSFCVVRGPEIMMGQDVHDFYSIKGKFDGIIGGPPCQTFSQARRNRNSTQLNLIPVFERIIDECEPLWFIMENVGQAPLPKQMKFNCLINAWDYGSKQKRSRRFSSNINIFKYLHKYILPQDKKYHDPFPCVTATEYKEGKNKCTGGFRRAARKMGRRLKISEVNELMGLPSNFDTPCLKVEYQYKVRGNGVCLEVGRTLAKCVKDYYNDQTRTN